MEGIQALLKEAAAATRAVRQLTSSEKKTVLLTLARHLRISKDLIITENQQDLVAMPDEDPKKDRLMLDGKRIEELAASVEAIADLPDPSSQLLSEKTLENGLLVQKKTVPLGVVGVIYESRPNVTIDVAALCIRSGNVCVLRGGTDALYTNNCLVNIIKGVLEEHRVDKAIVQLLPADRKHITELLTATRYVDIIIPRGSQQLIDHVRAHSRVPVIETGAGVCHTYIEKTADLKHAVAIVVNAKVSRPSVCNALDTILIDQSVASLFIEQLAPEMAKHHVEIFADQEAYEYLKKANYPKLERAKEEDFGREFLDYKCSIKIVQGFEEAIGHIATHSSKHSEAIISEDQTLAEQFLNEVDAAAVYVNASTRFTDGGVFGLGAEIGISTQKLHARGPFALEKLVTEKWFVRGNGQIR